MKTFLGAHKIQFLISITLSVILVSVATIKEPLTIFWVFLFSMLSMFVLDLDYIIHAYFTEPDEKFSINLRTFVKHKDYSGMLRHLQVNKGEIKEPTLNSAMFQIILSLVGIFAINSNVFFGVKALIVTLMANTLYRSIEIFFTQKTAEWFWSFKTSPNKTEFLLYILGMFGVLIYCLFLF